MSRQERSETLGVVGRASVVLLGLGLALGASSRDAPRCPEGLIALGARCCGGDQRLERGACVGPPRTCSIGMTRTALACVADDSRVVIEGGVSSWKSPDTQAASSGQTAKTGAFAIDRYEVTWSRYRTCAGAGVCPWIKPTSGGDDGQAVSLVTRDEARSFCRWSDGRLPTDAEWLRIAIGDHETRYPWGDPDALCLRATWSLTNGRCGQDALGPDLAGARPWGATPSGIHDLAGNVAEWVDDAAPVGRAAARGGAWSDDDAALLRARSQRVFPIATRKSWIGFRCAYEVRSPQEQ